MTAPIIILHCNYLVFVSLSLYSVSDLKEFPPPPFIMRKRRRNHREKAWRTGRVTEQDKTASYPLPSAQGLDPPLTSSVHRISKTKAITALANHKELRQSVEPIKTLYNCKQLTRSAGKRVRTNCDWFWFNFSLDEKLARVFLSQSFGVVI